MTKNQLSPDYPAVKTAVIVDIVEELKNVDSAAAQLMTELRNRPEEPRKLNLEEKIQRIEDITFLISIDK